MKVSLNDFVKVKLTKFGYEIHKRDYEKLQGMSPYFANRPYKRPKLDSDGYFKMQLHTLMNTFGQYTILGNETPFVDNYIEFEDISN